MKLKFTGLFIVLFLVQVLSPNSAYSQALTEHDDIIREQVRQTVVDYYASCTFSTDGKTIDLDKVFSFKKLFAAEDVARLYNDIEPDQQSGNMLTLDDYSSKLQLAYESGVMVSMKPYSANISPAYPYAKGKVYIVNASVDKMVFGLYKNEKIQDFSGKLIFQITFDMKSGSPVNFKIANIATPDLAIDIVKEGSDGGGLLWGVTGGYSITGAYGDYNYSEGLNSPSPSVLKGFTFGLELIVPITAAIRIKSGLDIRSYDGEESFYDFNTTTDYDPDGDEYDKIINIDFSQTNKISTIEMPIELMVVLFPRKSFNIYAYSGISIIKVRSASYSTDGRLKIEGYYPQYNVTLSDIPEYYLYDNTYNGEEGDFDLSGGTSFNFGAGLMFGKKMKVRTGVYLGQSSGLDNNSSDWYLKDSYNLSTMAMFNFGLSFSILF